MTLLEFAETIRQLSMSFFNIKTVVKLLREFLPLQHSFN